MPGFSPDAALPHSTRSPFLNTRTRLTLGVTILLAAALVACTSGGGSTAVPTASSTPPPAQTATATSTPVDPGPPRPETDRVIEHVRVLSEEIGPRLAGSAEEEAAVAYAREQFERSGYQVEVQSFRVTAPTPLLGTTRFSVTGPDPLEIDAVAMGGSAPGQASGPLLAAGTGQEEDLPADAEGAVLLIQRRDVPFSVMASRAADVGAVAVVVINREPGLFPGELDPPSGLQVIGVSQPDGESLLGLLADGSVDVNIDVTVEATAQNVIARPEGGRCRTLSGGHLDSVTWAPGANDNASGSGLVLELARAAATAGLEGHCFALFGAEELGLLGSAFFASELTEAERDELSGFFNYDVVAGDARPLVTGSAELLDRAALVADGRGVDVQVSSRPREIASDHLSFMDADLPAVIITSPDFDRIHTPQDTLSNLEPTALEAIATLGYALLQEAESQ